jgi:hypothetical protein
MLPAIDKTPDFLNISETAAALDISPAELGIRRKIGALPEPVATLRTGHSGRPRFLWSRAAIEAFKASGLRPAAE